MKKVSKFYLSRQKKFKDLVRQIEEIVIEDERKKLNKIVSERKQKWKQATFVSDLRLPNFNHLRKQYTQFSKITSNASHEPFVTEKEKAKLITSNRAYSSTPNLKAGAVASVSVLKNDTEDPQILNRMFNEYDRLIEEQSLGGRVKAQKQVERNFYLPKCEQKKQQTFDKTYFQKFTTHRFNIDKTSDYHSITELMARKCATDRKNLLPKVSEETLAEQRSQNSYVNGRIPSARSKIFETKKLKRLHSTLDSTGNNQSQIFDSSILDRSTNSAKRANKDNTKSSKKSIHSKTHIRPYKLKESKAKFVKNLNSLELS